jgi:RNA polymerase sporulation-specific sigma factor
MGENSFLPILTKEEEAELIANINTDETARKKLIEHNLRLVAHIVKKYQNHKNISQDLISIGTIGLIKGVNSYKPDKNTRLATYAARCIENEILMFLRQAKKYQNDISMQETLGTDSEGNEVKIEDKLALEGYSIEEEVHKEMKLKSLLEAIDKVLHGREKEIVQLRYGLLGKEEMTQREIAHLLGISRSYVSKISMNLQQLRLKNVNDKLKIQRLQ